MTPEDVARILAPVWIGFAAAEERIQAMLSESMASPMERGNASARLRHEAEMEDARSYLAAKARAFQGFGLMQALDTGRTVLLWPKVYPTAEAYEHAITAWRAHRKAGPEVLKRPA